MYDLTKFSRTDMNNCAIALRNMNVGAKSMEEVAERMVRHLYEQTVDAQTGEPACALVRFFRTYSYRQLNDNLQEAARDILGGKSVAPGTKCLTLLATAGQESYWNSRADSSGHKAIPLVDKDFIDRAPMISQLIQQFGLEISTVLEPNPEILVDLERTTFNVFYIPEALGSPHIPAQKEFVVPYQVQSILGFGGMLPSGNLFAIILFSKVQIPREAADSFKWVSAYARIAAAAFDKKTVFAGG